MNHANYRHYQFFVGELQVPELKRLKGLQEENSGLKRMHANLSLVHEAYKEVVAKNL